MVFIIFNEWFTFSLILLGIWFIVFFAGKKCRKKLLIVSLFTMLFGLSEPLFVPTYWHPPSLFNLAASTGFDVESLIFSFAVGGIGATLYDLIFRIRHNKMSMKDMHGRRHRYHKLALASPFIAFAILYLVTKLNPIYSATIALCIGGLATMLCRPDLSMRIIIGGFLFLTIYFIFFLSFNLAYPYALTNIWNLSSISGILILGIPLEELMFAFSFGLMWSSVYEHFNWYLN